MSQITTMYEKLEQLKTERENLVTQQQKVEQELKNVNNQLKQLQQQIRQNSTKAKKKKQNGSNYPVTDHAIIRYLERVNRIDPNELRKKVCPYSEDTIKKLGDGQYPMDTHQIVVKNKRVVTII